MVGIDEIQPHRRMPYPRLPGAGLTDFNTLPAKHFRPAGLMNLIACTIFSASGLDQPVGAV